VDAEMTETKRLHILVKITPKTALPFEDFQSELNEIGELDEGHLEIKESADGYEVNVDKDAWIRSYEERGCLIKEEERTCENLAKIYADEILGMIYDTKTVKVEVQIK
jgi:hypothetical protein